MFHLVKQSFKTITPEMCDRLDKINTFSGQRPLDASWVNELRNRMENGQFTVGNIAVAKHGDYEWLMNGQHQCAAGMRARIPFQAVYLEYDLDEISDTWKLYATFDMHRKRSINDVFRAAKPSMSGILKDLPISQSTRITAALFYMTNENRPIFNLPRGLGGIDRLETVDGHEDEVVMCAEYVGHKHLRREPVYMAIIATYRAATEQQAREFWDRVADGANLATDDPRFVLRDYLLAAVISGGPSVIRRNIFCACIQCWNAWAAGEKRRFVRLLSDSTCIAKKPKR